MAKITCDKKYKRKPIILSLSHGLAIRLSLILGFLLISFMFIGYTLGEKTETVLDINRKTAGDIVIHLLTVLIPAYLFFECCFWIFRKNWEMRKKSFLAFLGVIGLAIVVSPVISKIALHILQTVPISDERQNIYIIASLVRDLVISLIVYLTTITISTAIRYQQVSLENEKLLVENMRNRYEALKNQLNPHFLFNTLNTLDGLIGFDDEKAHNYLQNLSSSFRYTIQNKEITTLKEELDFVKSYAYLMKIRYGDNLSIKYNIDEKYCDFLIMPISLQLLMENAVKHNVINDKHPLTIFIETTENDTIKVSNTIQPKINAETGEGVGLANLVERYNLLFGKEVLITQNGVFGVEIPLIESTNNS